MSTTVEFDLLKQEHVDKLSTFEVCIGEDLTKVGYAELNIAKYTETQNVIEKLMLTPMDGHTLSENAHLEVRVNTKESNSSSKVSADKKGASARKASVSQLASISEMETDDDLAKTNTLKNPLSKSQTMASMKRGSVMSTTTEQAQQIRDDFAKQEVIYQKQIRDLQKRVHDAQDDMREATLELSVTYDKKLNIYSHLDQADKEVMLKKDV